VSGGTEHGIDAWPLQILARPVAQMDVSGVEEQMVIRRSDIDPALLNRLAIGRVYRLENAGPRDDLGKNAVALSANVNGNEHCGWKICWKAGYNLLYGIETACRRTDDDNVPDCHSALDAGLAAGYARKSQL
jgi:hypothetical protein